MENQETGSTTYTEGDWGRYHAAIVELSRMEKAHFDEALRAILRKTSETLDVRRVSYWKISSTAQQTQTLPGQAYALTRCLLYSSFDDEFTTKPVVLNQSEYPNYFQALEQCRTIVAHDAVYDAATCEFAEQYLTKFGISSMLVTSVWYQGTFDGILSIEHMGSTRRWIGREVDFAHVIGEMISHSLEAEEREVSERQRAVSESRNESIISALPDPVLQLNKEGVIIGVSSPINIADTLLSKAVVGKKYREVLSPKFADALDCATAGAFLQGQLNKFTYAYSQKGRLLKEYEVRVVFSRAEEFLVLCRDITECKAAERAIMLVKEQAGSALNAKSQLISNMSHEIRTPMNGILGMTDLVLGTDLTDEQREHLEMVKQSAQSLLDILNDIVDFSKVEAGKLTLSFESIKIDEVLRKSLAAVQGRAAQKEIDIITDIGADLPEWVKSDSARLAQIINVLLNNAIKFTPSKGVIRVSASRVRTQALTEKKTSTIRFVVEDSGVGIAEEKLDSIFNAFSEENDLSERTCGGIGLGLNIARSIVGLMGGRIWVESDEGKGSKFSVEIPFEVSLGYIERGLVDEIRAQHNTLCDLSGLNVLVVEDNEANQRLVSALLERRKCSVTIAKDGSEAVSLYRESMSDKPFDMILMDCELPGMSGLLATREIRDIEEPLDKHVPIIALTAHAMEGDKQKAILAGMDDYVSKPFNAGALADAMAKWVERRR